jgi:hypothetical protein
MNVALESTHIQGCVRKAVGQTVLVAGQVSNAEPLPKRTLRLVGGDQRSVLGRRRGGSCINSIVREQCMRPTLPPHPWRLRLSRWRLLLLMTHSKTLVHAEAGALAWTHARRQLNGVLRSPAPRPLLLHQPCLMRGRPA